MARREGSLFSFSEVVFGISVQDELANRDKRIVRMWPNLGDIEDIPSVFVAIIDWHDLDVKSPGSVAALSDMLEEILGSVISVS
jgi:hypothetical protein